MGWLACWVRSAASSNEFSKINFPYVMPFLFELAAGCTLYVSYFGQAKY